MTRLRPTLFIAALSMPLAAAPMFGQNQDGNFHWSKALAAGSDVSVHNISGDIRVKPSTSGKVEIVGIKHGSSRDFDRIRADVHESSRGITVCVLYEDDDSCDEDGMHTHHHGNNDRDFNASMDFEVAVPTNVVVSAGSVSGNVEIDGAHGDVDAGSVSGNVRLEHLHAAAIRAHTVSGDIIAAAEDLDDHGDLSFNTVSGDVTLTLPKSLDADFSMSTVSGDVDSDFPLTLGNGRMSRRGLSARIGKGGRRLEVRTVSGDLRLRMAK